MDGDNGGYVMAGKRLQDQIDSSKNDCVPKLAVHHLIPDISLNGDTTSASWNDETSLDVDLELGSVVSNGSLFAESQWSAPPPLLGSPASFGQQSSSSLDPQDLLPIRQSSTCLITTVHTPSPSLTTKPGMPHSTSSPPTTKRPNDDGDDQPPYHKTDTPLKTRRVSPSTTLETGTDSSSSSLDHAAGRDALNGEDELPHQEEEGECGPPVVLGVDERLPGKNKGNNDDCAETDTSYSTIAFDDESAILKNSTTGVSTRKSKKKKKKRSKKKKETEDNDDIVLDRVATSLLLQQCREAPKQDTNVVALEVAT